MPGASFQALVMGAGVSATAPVVNGTRTTSSVASGASQDLDCTLPSGIVAGEMLVVIVATDGNTAADWGWPAGWTAISGTTNLPIAGAYRIATGSDGSTVNAGTNVTTKLMACTYRISNFTGAPEMGTAASGTSAAANPPSLTWSWGSFPTLVIAAMTLNSSTVASAAPSGYSSLTTKVQGGDHAAWAERAVTAASEDPGAFTNANAAWFANTFAIQGA